MFAQQTFCYTMKLLLTLSLLFVTQGPVGVQSFKKDRGTVDWSKSEVGRLLTRFIDQPEIADKLRRLRGTWPFNDTYRCDSMNTRDNAYRNLAERGHDFQLRAVPSCGYNQLTSGSTRRRLLKRLLHKFHVEERRNSHDSRSQNDKRMNGGKNDRVVGGEEIVAGTWPWLAAVGSTTGGPRCGGSLIADRWVLTAAHCFTDTEAPCAYNVRLGSKNWLYDDEGHHVDMIVQAIYRHPDYDINTMRNDVALLKLRKPVGLDQNGFVNAVCLPSGSQSLPVGTVCIAAGWGKIAENASGRELNAREVELPIMAYNGHCGKYNGKVPPGTVCAGYTDGIHDTCQGDSGGPLTHNVAGRWTLIGITSFGDGCARPGYPGVYTDVGNQLKWIASVLSRFN